MSAISIYNTKAGLNILKKIPLVIILSIGFFLRIYQLEIYPSQIQVDELSNIYDGYSITQTGADRWGAENPVIIRGYGNNDYRPPLYTWLCAIAIKLFGYSVFSGRLPSVIFGTLSLIILYLTSKKIGGEVLAYTSLIFATLSPWHIVFSRLALESGALASFFLILCLYLFITTKESSFKSLYVALLGFCIGFATNDYQATKLIFLIVFLLVLLYILIHSTNKIKAACLLIFFTSLGALPQLYAAFNIPEHFFSRASNTMIPFQVSFAYFTQVFENFFANLSPAFLFLSFGTYNNLTVIRLLPVEMPFFYLGLITFYWSFKTNKSIKPSYIYLLIAVAILPSALTFDNPHALRTSCNIILYPVMSASGFLFVYKWIKNTNLKKGFASLCLIVLFSNFAIYSYGYINKLFLVGQQSLLVEVAKRLNQYQSSFNKIYIEDIGNQPYMYVTYYCNIQPQVFRKLYKKNIGIGWDHFRQIGKFYFLKKETVLKKLEAKEPQSLYILGSSVKAYQAIDSISLQWQTFYFYKN